MNGSTHPERRRPFRIAVTNAVLANGGDAAIFAGLVYALRKAYGEDAAFTVFDANPALTRPLFPEHRVLPSVYKTLWNEGARGLPARVRRQMRWRLGAPRVLRAARLLAKGNRDAARRLAGAQAFALLDELRAADLVVSTGGTYLVESYGLGPRLFELALVRALGQRLVFFTQSLGPFTKKAVRRGVGRALREAPLVLLRDEPSRRHALDVGAPPERLRLAADAALALADADVLDRAKTRAWPASAPRVAVSVRDWPHFRTVGAGEGMARFNQSVAAAVTHLVETRGAEVVFLSTCQGLPGYRYDDAAAADAVVALLHDEVRARVSVDRLHRRPEELIEALGAFDLVLATRMHAAILALVAGTPALPIAYEFKTRLLFEGLGRADWVEEIETIAPDGLITTVERVLSELPVARADLFARVEALRADALAAGHLVRNAVEAR